MTNTHNEVFEGTCLLLNFFFRLASQTRLDKNVPHSVHAELLHTCQALAHTLEKIK